MTVMATVSNFINTVFIHQFLNQNVFQCLDVNDFTITNSGNNISNNGDGSGK
jgi:hypothetical protein